MRAPSPLPCWFLGEALPVVGGPVFAILIGMVIALWWKQPARGIVQDGIGFTAKKVLQYAVILLGFGLNLAQIAAVGAESLPIILTTIATALIVGYILYRVLSHGFRHRHAHRRGLVHLRRLGHRRHGAGHPRQGRAGGPGHLGHLPVQRHRGAHLPYLWEVMLGMSNEGFGLFAGTAVERHLVGHRRRGRLGRHASRHPTPWTTPPS